MKYNTFIKSGVLLMLGLFVLVGCSDNETPMEPNHGYPLTPDASFNRTGDMLEDRPLEFDFDMDDGVCITMVWIPPGEFEMGSPEDEIGRDHDEEPVHTVKIEKGFWMGKYEVTQSQWAAVTGTNHSAFAGDNRPVEMVSWNEVNSYIDRLNDGFRLPSESEWEYACRAGSRTRLHWGDDSLYAEANDYAWHNYNSHSETHDVGGKLPNAWGLYDMTGNVYEWCEDGYHDSYDGAPTDGSPWIQHPGSENRVLRGGTWLLTPRNCRSACRYNLPPNIQSNIAGFRLALDL